MPRSRAAEPDLILANARLVLENELVAGSLAVANGHIVAVDQGRTVPRGATDCEGDLLAPGLVELHTDNLERHLHPRPGVDWPAAPAVIAHDAELASCGITTVFDALRVGSMHRARPSGYGRAYARALCDAITGLYGEGALKISHRLHLRAEICSETLEQELATFAEEDGIGIVSLMDHTPGQRQFRDIAALRRFARSADDMSETEFATHVAELKALGARVGPRHREAAIGAARRLGAVIASHDDTTAEQVADSASIGAQLAEFPTSREAAGACRSHGIAVMMGAPNVLRGGSHSGNVAAAELEEAGLLDILSSDYAPPSLLQGALAVGRMRGDLARGLASVTAVPARVGGLADRGRLAPGLRADLVRIRLHEAAPLLRGVWAGGHRVG